MVRLLKALVRGPGLNSKWMLAFTLLNHTSFHTFIYIIYNYVALHITVGMKLKLICAMHLHELKQLVLSPGWVYGYVADSHRYFHIYNKNYFWGTQKNDTTWGSPIECENCDLCIVCLLLFCLLSFCLLQFRLLLFCLLNVFISICSSKSYLNQI